MTLVGRRPSGRLLTPQLSNISSSFLLRLLFMISRHCCVSCLQSRLNPSGLNSSIGATQSCSHRNDAGSAITLLQLLNIVLLYILLVSLMVTLLIQSIMLGGTSSTINETVSAKHEDRNRLFAQDVIFLRILVLEDSQPRSLSTVLYARNIHRLSAIRQICQHLNRSTVFVLCG